MPPADWHVHRAQDSSAARLRSQLPPSRARVLPVLQTFCEDKTVRGEARSCYSTRRAVVVARLRLRSQRHGSER